MEFSFTSPDDDAPDSAEPAEEPLIGTAESADERIRAVISRDGRLRELYLDPAVLQRSRDGAVMDSTTLADEITRTVNAAMDDLVEKYQRTTRDDFAEVQTRLAATTEDFQRELDQISADIIRARQRLQEP